mgnify:FL=1|tara:strand:+ start:9788 stop:10759 length:972 start_codon:yes stop_codon:yes gene_type:complete
MAAWAGNGSKAATAGESPAPVETNDYGVEYYRNLFNKKKVAAPQQRMALVGKENTAKTGLALYLSRSDEQIKAGKKVVIFDFDNSASETVNHTYPGDENILILPLLDLTDDSIFNEDMSVKWPALIDKTNAFVNLMAQEIQENPGDFAAVIFDGGSTYMKWCENAMTWFLMNRSKNPINVEDGDRFNQAEWRTRNKLFRDTITRVHGLPIDKVYFTFHLKDNKQFADLGNGAKGLMKIGEKPDWVEGTQRIMSQQLFMGRYQKRADSSAGVYADKTLNDGEFAIKARIEEVKGQGMDLIGQERTVLTVKNGEVVWSGIPELRW